MSKVGLMSVGVGVFASGMASGVSWMVSEWLLSCLPVAAMTVVTVRRGKAWLCKCCTYREDDRRGDRME
jgi:hypothetical protein